MADSKVLKIDHIGIAVTDLNQAIEQYSHLLGQAPNHLEDVLSERVKTAFFDVDGVAIELLQATDATSPIAQFIAKNNRGGVHHICLEVDDLKQKLFELKNAGFRLIDEVPKKGAHGKWVAFVHPHSAGHVLIELSQKSQPETRL